MFGTFKKLLIAGLATATLSSPATHAAEKVRWLNDWLPAGDKAAIYLAVQQGMFKKAGIDVQIMSGRGSSDVITKLATGTADMGTAALPALLQAKVQGDVPVTAVMSVYNEQPDAVFTAAGSGIKTLADLQGKTLATPTFSASNVTWPLILRANHIDPNSIKLLKVDPGAMAPMLATGRVDGTINWVTTAPGFRHELAQNGKKLKMIPWSQFGFDGYGLSVVASNRLIQEKPELVAKVVHIFEKAVKLAVSHPDLAGKALKAMVPEADEKVAAAQYKASVPLIENRITQQEGFGVFNPKRLETTWKWVAEAQNLPLDKLNPTTAVTSKFLQ